MVYMNLMTKTVKEQINPILKYLLKNPCRNVGVFFFKVTTVNIPLPISSVVRN